MRAAGLTEDQVAALSVLDFIVNMIEFDLEEGHVDHEGSTDDIRLFQYSSGGASGFLTLGHARSITQLLKEES